MKNLLLLKKSSTKGLTFSTFLKKIRNALKEIILFQEQCPINDYLSHEIYVETIWFGGSKRTFVFSLSSKDPNMQIKQA